MNFTTKGKRVFDALIFDGKMQKLKVRIEEVKAEVRSGSQNAKIRKFKIAN